MAQTALDLSPQQWKTYRLGQSLETRDANQTRRSERRRQQAWQVAHQAAKLLRQEYGATKVIVFGSLIHEDWFTSWSDIDLAAWEIPPERFYSAVAAVTGISPIFRVDLVDPDACQPGLRKTLERGYCAMNEGLLRLATRIRDDLTELDRVAVRVTEGWARTLRNADDYYLDGVALNLHGFYSGLERIFERIAATIDGERPKGENWHQVLLLQMATEMPGLRPAVISQTSYHHLDDYRGFRHVVRNVYAYNFELAKIQKLVNDLPPILTQIRAELLAFAEFLEQQGSV